MEQTPFVREDLYRFEWLGAPRLTPDGTRFAYAKKTVADDRQGYRNEIFVGDLATGTSRPFTRGGHDDRIVDITDEVIVLLSDRAGDTQAYVLPLAGGEARQVTFIKGGVKDALMSPDGGRLIVLVRIKEGEQVEYTSGAPGRMRHGTADGGESGSGTPAPHSGADAAKKPPTPYEVKRLSYKADGVGLWDGTYTQLAVVEVATSAVQVLTEGPFHVEEFCCSPDGGKIAYTSRRHEDDRAFFKDLYVLDTLTASSVKISDGSLSLGAPEFSPDGREVACFGSDMEFAGATQTAVYIADIAARTLTRLAPRDFVYALEATGMSDMRGHEHTPGPLFTAAGDAVLAPYSAKGSVSLAFFYRDGRVAPVVQGDREVFAYDCSRRTGGIVFAATDPGDPNNLFYLEPDHATERRLTAFNEWLQERIIAPVDSFVVAGVEGQELQGWCVTPRLPVAQGESATAKTPVVLQVHGGPHAMYSHSFVFEFQLLAAAGFAVVYGNPRGSSGYGQAFVDACRGDYGGGDYRDLMAILDSALAARPTLDGDRMGVTGGSYGGFMTNWIVGHTDRFKAAVTQRSISNWISFNGVSDIGFFFTEWEMKWSSHQTHWTDIEKLWNHSPLKYASAVQTPLLILHGEDDLRCPIEQAEQLYVALRVLDKEVEFVRFPKANHDLSRTGHPQLRVERYRCMTEWFGRFV